MGLYLNRGNESFRSIIDDEYIDKSAIISEFNKRINKRTKLVCLSRPRRFGKSMLAKLLNAYYDASCDSQSLFTNLVISHDPSFETFLNSYPVIYLDISWFISNCGSILNVLSYLQEEVMAELKEFYPKAEGGTLPRFLASAATIYNQKFIIIIDEWDAIIREAKSNTKLQEEYVVFLRGLFKSSLTDDMFALAFMTGILPIKKYGTQSALTDFQEYTMLDPGVFAPYTGFTESEVIDLCKKHCLDFHMAKRWYDGYSFDNKTSIYNPNSIMNCITNKKYTNYWSKTESYESLKVYIDMDFDGIKQDLIQMIGGNSCKINTISFQNDMVSINSKDDVFTLLVHLGYLAYNSELSTVSIPNNEIREEFEASLKNSSHTDLAQMIKDSENLLENTLQCNESEVAAAIERAHDAGTAPLFYNNEQALRSVIKFAYISAVDSYVQIQELPSGKGFADVVFIPKRTSDFPVLIIELKWNKPADSAIGQIKQKNYPAILQNLSTPIILVGITYDDKTHKHDCRIERLEIAK